jgi:hypothetical protein
LPTIAELEAKIAQFHKELEAAKVAQPVVKLDLGCGTMKKEGFIGVDSRRFPESTWCATSAAMCGRGRTARSTR